MALDMNNFSTDMTEKEAVYSDKKLRIGIIGTGGIAHSHIRAYQHQPDVEIVAACDLIPGKAEKFLKEYNVEAPTFEGYKKMIDTVPMDARPLAQEGREAFLARFRDREPVYRFWADQIVTDFSSPEATVNAILEGLS